MNGRTKLKLGIPTDHQQLDGLEDDIIERIMGGESQASIARSFGVSCARMCVWVLANAERTAKIKEARAVSARHWDEAAITELRSADTAVAGSVAIAREIAAHYRWRAKAYNPREYGDRTVLAGTGRDDALAVDVRESSDNMDRMAEIIKNMELTRRTTSQD
jgi:hypothetical protein